MLATHRLRTCSRFAPVGCHLQLHATPPTFVSNDRDAINVSRDAQLRALVGGDQEEPSLLHFFTAAVWTDNCAVLVFPWSQCLREGSITGVTEKFVVGHESGPPAPHPNCKPQSNTLQSERPDRPCKTKPRICRSLRTFAFVYVRRRFS